MSRNFCEGLMKRKTEYSTKRLWSGRFPAGAIAVAAALCFAAPLLGDAIAGVPEPTGPDPILSGLDSWDGPCTKATGVEYSGGSDVYGNPVVSADVPSDSITVGMQNEVAIPEVLTRLPNLDRVRVNVAVNGLSKAVQPDPACPQDSDQAPAKTSKSR
jgi:hypothetical protein